jgi:hypothetical protein
MEEQFRTSDPSSVNASDGFRMVAFPNGEGASERHESAVNGCKLHRNYTGCQEPLETCRLLIRRSLVRAQVEEPLTADESSTCE